MTQATARRELRTDLATGRCSACAATLTTTKRINRDDHTSDCKLIHDACLPRRKRDGGPSSSKQPG